MDPCTSALPAAIGTLSRFPPTTIVTSEFDYLRLQGEQFATRLEVLGAPARIVRYGGVATTGPLSYWGRVPKRRTSALTSPASSESWRESPGADSSAAVNAQLTASGRLCETRTCSTGRHARSHCGKRILVYSHGPSVVGVGPSCARRKGVMRELGPVYSSSVEGCAASDHAENE